MCIRDRCLVKINGEVVKACQVRIGEGETCVVETLDRAEMCIRDRHICGVI